MVCFRLWMYHFWGSRGQNTVSISSTEAEYVSLTEVWKEILYVRQILFFMGVKVTLPIRVRVDNSGAIFMTRNSSAGKSTKHIDVWYHFVRKYEEDGSIILEFVGMLENVSDIFTTNTSGQTFYELINKFMNDEVMEWLNMVGCQEYLLCHLYVVLDV